MGAGPGPVTGPDGVVRCPWPGEDPTYIVYHDTEWGRPSHDERALFEKLCLETFQAGLSWLTILRKRDAFRRAFLGFDPAGVAELEDRDVERLLGDAGIVRNRAKIEAAVANARALLGLHGAGGTLSGLVWSHAPPAPAPAPATMQEVPASTDDSARLAAALKRHGFRFLGPTTCYALMQAMGVVDDHLAGCWRRADVVGR